jgi:signal transduction histidine kinase
MDFFFINNRKKIVSVVILAVIAIASLLYTQFVLKTITEQERTSVELWAKAIEYTNREHNPESRQGLQEILDAVSRVEGITAGQRNRWIRHLERAINDLSVEGLEFVANELIIKNPFEIPSIVTAEDGTIMHHRNIDDRQLNASTVARYAAMNDPIEIIVLGTNGTVNYQFAYFGQSGVVRSLRFFPYIQFGLLTIFLGLLYFNISNLRRTEQSNLWVGMAKEAAHQLGTPLSSMMGWIELLRSSSVDSEILGIAMELEEDVLRLQKVADRFNKIGSAPERKPQRIEPVLNQVVDYIERRIPRIGKNVEIRRDISTDLKIALNTDLFTWAIENLMKNALDAIDVKEQGGYIHIRTLVSENKLIIELEDNGKGIERRYHEAIFTPGFSTKKRGWGLGLSLTRRIIEEYHDGRIIVNRSTPGEGTVFRITMPVN